jgi:hypothetical protein
MDKTALHGEEILDQPGKQFEKFLFLRVGIATIKTV